MQDYKIPKKRPEKQKIALTNMKRRTQGVIFMGTQKLKAAVISAGMIANSGHIPAYKAFSQDVSLEAVCDLNASAARDTALRHDIPRWYSDVAAMLEEVHPDLVSVCTPNSTHKGLVAQALKAGANVICEKPLTLHYADTVGLYALAEKLGKQLVVPDVPLPARLLCCAGLHCGRGSWKYLLRGN